MSKKCTNPAVGRLLARYEFGKVTEQEKKAFEQHLLECEACYEELYSFAPLREIIKNNIKEFQKAARPRKSFASALINSIITARKNITDIFNNLPQTAKVAIPGIAVVIMVITVYFFSLRPQFDDFNLIVQKDSEDLILHPPDHIASKAYGDSATAAGWYSAGRMFLILITINTI